MCLSLHSLQKKEGRGLLLANLFLDNTCLLAQEKSRLQYFPEAGTLRKGSAHQVSTSTPCPHHPRPCPGTSSISQISPHFHLQYFSSASSKYCQFSRSSAKNLGSIAVAYRVSLKSQDLKCLSIFLRTFV